MGNAQRAKGVAGERYVMQAWQRHGFEVRGLEGQGDHLVLGHGLVIHSEVKRQETCRPWLWVAQAAAECPEAAVPVVAFRRNRSDWLALVPFEQLAGMLARGAT